MTVVASAQDNLAGVLKKKYVLAQTTMMRDQISVPGTVMAVQTNGINAEPWDTLVTFDNPIVDGNVQQHNKFTGLLKSKNMRILQPGDRVYITKIESKTDNKGDVLKLTILSVDAADVDGGASQKRYSAVLSFRLPQGALLHMSPDDAQRTIEKIIAPDNGGDQGGGAAQPTAAAAPAPAPVAAPPPPPPQPGTQTIAMGQSIADVVAIMGQPKQIIDLGEKKTYKYPNLSVIFVDGKVSDVQ